MACLLLSSSTCGTEVSSGMQGLTQAPPKLSERDLITAMERHGIGTDATVADHIKKQLDRGYAIKDHAALFSPSPLGEALIAGYHRMGLSNLWQPNLRFAAHIYTLSRLPSQEEWYAHPLDLEQ